MRRQNVPLIGSLVVGAHFALFERGRTGHSVGYHHQAGLQSVGNHLLEWFAILAGPTCRTCRGNARGNILCVRSSNSPQNHPFIPEKCHPTTLSEAITNDLADREAIFLPHCGVQIHTDAEAMPVEDVTVKWDEDVSKPITVATLRIGVQTVDPNGWPRPAVRGRCRSVLGTHSRNTACRDRIGVGIEIGQRLELGTQQRNTL